MVSLSVYPWFQPIVEIIYLVHGFIAMKTTKKMIVSLAALGLMVCANTGGAVTLAFERVTSNSSLDISGDLSLEVTDGGMSTVLFTFSKTGMSDGFITQVYFEDSLSLLTSINFSAMLSTGLVAYHSPATPANPPGVKPFITAFSFAPNNPQPTNGISTGEQGVFIGNLANPATLTDLTEAIENGDLRVALHAQGLLNDESDSFAVVAAPEPSASLLGGIALLILLTRRARP